MAIKTLADKRDEVYSLVAEVTAVDTAERTCDVTPVNGDAEIFGVRLQSVLNGDKGLAFIPVVGSQVVISFLSKEAAYVAAFSEVQIIEFKIEPITMLLDENGLRLASSSTDLKAEIDALIDELKGLVTTLKTFQVLTPSGPSTAATGTSLTNLISHEAEFTAIKQRLSTLLQ